MQALNGFSLLMVLAMLLWAGGWSALKITTSVDVSVLTLYRFIIMTLSFIPILWIFKEKITLPKQALKFIFTSAILNVSFMIFSYYGVKYSTAGNGGVIITTLTPLFTFLATLILFKNVHSKQQYFGLFLGLLGGLIMLGLTTQLGDVYFVLAAMIWAFVTLLAQQSRNHIHPIHYSFFISLVATIILLIINSTNTSTTLLSPFSQDWKFWSALLYLGILAQSIATTIFFVASGKLGSSKASSYMFIVPLFALIIGYLLLDEEIVMETVIGGTIATIAIYFINQTKQEKN